MSRTWRRWTAIGLMTIIGVMGSRLCAAEDAQDGWSAFFPDGLINSAGEPLVPEVLNGKLVALFFSAQWCPPCRTFTPVLAEFRNAHQDQFEVVLISHDGDDERQLAYMADYKMPWPGLRQSDPRTEALKKEHGVSGIPTLIVVSQGGEVLEPAARRLIQSPASIPHREQESGNAIWEGLLAAHYAEWRENHSARVVYPETWTGEEALVIRYEPRNGMLAGADEVYLHHGFDGWSDEVLNQPMNRMEKGVWELAVTRRPGATELNFCFASGPLGAEQTRWDNNFGMDWRVPIEEEE